MGKLFHLPPHDERIDTECRMALPNHPHVARYLARTLRTNNGSVLVARILCDALAPLRESPAVSNARVCAFAAAESNEVLRSRLMEHLRSMDKDCITRSLNVGWRLRDTMERVHQVKNEQGPVPETRVCLAIKEGEAAKTLFMIIYSVAYAMLSDIPDELASDAAA